MSSNAHEYKNSLDRLQEIVKCLRKECPWDSVQTHEGLKPTVIEEAAEVIGGIRILSERGIADNLKEELGDLLLQVVMHAAIAEEEGLFTLEEVAEGICDKMVRRHPHIFHAPMCDENGNPVTEWNEIKKLEKRGREWEEAYLPEAFSESRALLEKACRRKGLKGK